MRAIATYILLPFSLVLFAQPDHPQVNVESRMFATNTNWTNEIGITFGGGYGLGRIGSENQFASSSLFQIGVEVEPLNNLFINPNFGTFPFVFQNSFYKCKVNNISLSIPVTLAGDNRPFNFGFGVGPVFTLATNQVYIVAGDREKYDLTENMNRMNVGVELSPQVRLRSNITDVTIKVGTTFMLGNLYTTQNSNQPHKSMPVLGQISIIGKLFTNRSHQRDRDNLIIFVTPNIIKSTE